MFTRDKPSSWPSFDYEVRSFFVKIEKKVGGKWEIEDGRC